MVLLCGGEREEKRRYYYFLGGLIGPKVEVPYGGTGTVSSSPVQSTKEHARPEPGTGINNKRTNDKRKK